MKRKSEADIDEYVMIKCQRFIFAPKDNKVINFCYKFENEPIEDAKSEEKDKYGNVPVVDEPSGGEEVGEFWGKVEGPVFELIEDEMITPAVSSEAMVIASEKVQLTETIQTSDNNLSAEPADSDVTEMPQEENDSNSEITKIENYPNDTEPIQPDSKVVTSPQINDSRIIRNTEESESSATYKSQTTDSQNTESPQLFDIEKSEIRPETPKTNLETVREPDSPIENRMMRKLSISDGKWIVTREKYIEFLRARKFVEEEQKVLKMNKEEFDARLEYMIQYETNFKMSMEEYFNVKVNEIVIEMMRVEEIYKMRLREEMEMRAQTEAKMNEMAAFIQQNITPQQQMEYIMSQRAIQLNDEFAHQQYEAQIRQQQEYFMHQNHPQFIQQQQQDVDMIQQNEAYLFQQQQEQQEQMMMQQREFERLQRESFEEQQRAQQVHKQQQQQQTGHQQFQQNQNHYQQQYQTQIGYNNSNNLGTSIIKEVPPKKPLFPVPTVYKTIQELEDEEFQKNLANNREKTRIAVEQAKQAEEIRRLEMRKMQHIRQAEIDKLKVNEENEMIKREQEKLLAIEEEKKKSAFDPFALLKMVPNVFGWNSTPAGQTVSVTSAQNGNNKINIWKSKEKPESEPIIDPEAGIPEVFRWRGPRLEVDKITNSNVASSGTVQNGSSTGNSSKAISSPTKSKLNFSNFRK